jgi:hypothetical protein
MGSLDQMMAQEGQQPSPAPNELEQMYMQAMQDPQMQQMMQGGGEPMGQPPIDPATIMPQQPPDPGMVAQQLHAEATVAVLQKIIELSNTPLDQLDPFNAATAVNSYASAFKTLHEAANQEEQIPAQLQFEMEQAKMEAQMQHEQQKMALEVRKAEMEMQFKRMEAELNLEIKQAEGQLKLEQQAQQGQQKDEAHLQSLQQNEEQHSQQLSMQKEQAKNQAAQKEKPQG